MNWKQINNSNRIQPSGVYKEWKQQISDDCFNQCVYCSIHENPWGGIDHYHIEHFRPKSIFEELENTITNLYHACPICNRFKSDDWPSDNTNDLDQICYPDPGEYNYSDLFEYDTNTHTLKGKYKASEYLVLRLYLNRPQLIHERRERLLTLKWHALMEEINENILKINDIELYKEMSQISYKITAHLQIRSNIVPYKLEEIRKQQ